MKSELIEQAYQVAKARYAELGIDTEKVIEQLQDFHLSMHCWQADDVHGFEPKAGAMSGGIQSTGDYPGAARNIDELRADILKAKSLIPGTHRLNLHEIYGEFNGKMIDRDECTTEMFTGWMQWGKENNTKLDFNSTNFSHPKSGNLTISNPNKEIREFWIEHMKRCRKIANDMGEYQQDPCIINLWIHDGSKDVTVNRMQYRSQLKESLDQILATKYQWDAYCSKNNVMVTLDTGHFHPTESIGDKVSSLLLFVPELMLHVSRPIRWDSDHVTIMDDLTTELFYEIVRAGAIDRVHYGLDYFDGTLNRVGAYVVGSRAAQKCMCRALLEPVAQIRTMENAQQMFEKLATIEEHKAMPWNAVYDEFCLRNDVPVGLDYIAECQKYEREVTMKR